MKNCFGIGLVAVNRDHLSDSDRKRCYECEDFDKCWKIMSLKSIHDLRIEIRESSVRIKNALGGAHSQFPFG